MSQTLIQTFCCEITCVLSQCGLWVSMGINRLVTEIACDRGLPSTVEGGLAFGQRFIHVEIQQEGVWKSGIKTGVVSLIKVVSCKTSLLSGVRRTIFFQSGILYLKCCTSQFNAWLNTQLSLRLKTVPTCSAVLFMADKQVISPSMYYFGKSSSKQIVMYGMRTYFWFCVSP